MFGKEKYEAEERIVKVLRQRGGTATAGDISGDTGLPYDKTEDALQSLLRSYSSWNVPTGWMTSPVGWRNGRLRCSGPPFVGSSRKQ